MVLREVPDGATMVGNPARQVTRGGGVVEPHPAFQPYAVCGDIPDPIARALNGLIDEVTSLRARVNEFEQKRQEAEVERPLPGEAPALRLVASAGAHADEGGARAS